VKRADTSDLWWKNAVFYCADIETFYDSDGDGTGDIQGMTDRLEYLTDLGVTCLWLMPFYPTARKDDGYDITDFFGVDPRLGTLGDFVELVRTARSNGIRIIIDFVMNHTSDQHPWFKSARRSVDDPYRDYYVWSATEPKSSPKDVVFPDQEDSIWELDPKTNEWYLHHFYEYQPDLNIENPKVPRHGRTRRRAAGFHPRRPTQRPDRDRARPWWSGRSGSRALRLPLAARQASGG
jgi:glycosidase